MGKLFALENIKPELKLINNKANNTSEILLYGAIGDSMWDDTAISAVKFSEKLKEVPSNTKEIHLRINSPGGSVFDGMTIYERLKQHNAKVIVYVDGVAASIASIIAMAGDEINIGEGSFFMIHKPMSGTYGNSDEHERTIQILDKIEEQMVSIYARKTGLSRTQISSMLIQDTWITSDESVEMKFADKKIEASQSLRLAATMVKNAKWLRNAPEIKVEEYKTKITDLQNKINKFLAR